MVNNVNVNNTIMNTEQKHYDNKKVIRMNIIMYLQVTDNQKM